MSRLIIIDGNSLINRAYYAIQKPMITADGFYTQAIYGFLNMLSKIRKDYEPTHMLVAFDRKAPTFRHIEYADYKAGRKKMPMELAMEMPVLKDILDAMGIYRFEIDGYEADDIIGTTAKMAEAQDLESFIITGDRDALQLATDLTKVIITKKGISEFKLYDDAAMIEEYGFDHVQFIDYKGLRGDSSDNIPGIAGVGDKTASKLIQQFGSIENMLAHSDEISSAKLREKIEDGAMDALMSKRLATIITNVPVDYSIDDLTIKDTDYEKLREIYNKLEFRKFLKELPQGNVAAPKTVAVPDDFDVIYGEESIASNLNGSVFIDIISDDSHIHKPTVECVQISKDGKCYVASGPDLSAFDGAKIKLNGYMLQRIYYIFESHGIDTSKMESEFDISLAMYLLNPNKKQEELVFDEESGPSQISMFASVQDTYMKCGRKFAKMTAMKEELAESLANDDLLKLYTDIELPLAKILASMESAGIKVDSDALNDAGKALGAKSDQLAKEIYELAGQEFNINSPKQLGVILFEKLQMPGAKKTKTGYATNADVLDKLAEDYPIVRKILAYRTYSKLKSTYCDGMLPLIDENGKVHPHFRQNVTATGRLSCTEPNLQNIPVRDEEGRQLRKLFTVDDDEYVLIGADYSQIELRVMAHMSGDKGLINAFSGGHDIHKETASRVFNVPLDEVTPAMRSNAKAVNFGVIYGMSSFGLSDELSISRAEAERYIKDYFDQFRDVKKFLDKCIADAKADGYVTTMYGRRRPIPEINASQYMVRQLGERLAMNTPIQGTAADIIKIAMIKVYDALAKECPKSRLILQIHDELIIHAHRSESEKVKKLLEENMKKAAKLKVSLDVSSEEGTNWYELK